jgi:glycosyl transferase family 87
MITIKRLRGYTTVIAICLWTVWSVDFAIEGPIDRLGKVKGTDFLQFYVVGSVAHEHRWGDLYDVRAQYASTQALAPTSRETLFVPVQSPQMALLFAPLAVHGYTAALAIWLTATVLLYGACCLLMWRECKALHGHGYVVAASCLAFPGLFSVVLHGQLSGVSLACLVAALLALRRGRKFVAGLALGVLVFKPHWVVTAGAVFLVAREWRVVAGIAIAAIGQVALTYAVVGSSVMNAYWRVLRSLPRIAELLEPRPGDSLKGFFQAFAPSQPVALALYGVAALVTLLLAARIWRSRSSFEIRCSAVVLALVLTNPHVEAYDLLLFVPVYFLLTNWLVVSGFDRRLEALPALLCLSFLAPLLTALPSVVRLLFSVGMPAAVLVILWRVADVRDLPAEASAVTAAAAIQ